MTKLRAAALSDIGKARTRNEDRCILDEPARVFGVADGVGGMPFGGEAAQAAHDAVIQEFRALAPDAEPELRKIILAANRAVATLGRSVSPGLGIATTLTLGLFRQGQVRIGHIGDSRAYAWHGGEFMRLTRDHTVAGEASRNLSLRDRLRISLADRHALTRCLGPAESPEVDVLVRPLLAGDRYLFCTDGLTNYVTDEEIAGVIQAAGEPTALLQELVALALRRGGSDNISGVLVLIDP